MIVTRRVGSHASVHEPCHTPLNGLNRSVHSKSNIEIHTADCLAGLEASVHVVHPTTHTQTSSSSAQTITSYHTKMVHFMTSQHTKGMTGKTLRLGCSTWSVYGACGCLGVDELCHTRLNVLNRSVYGACGCLGVDQNIPTLTPPCC